MACSGLLLYASCRVSASLACVVVGVVVVLGSFGLSRASSSCASIFPYSAA